MLVKLINGEQMKKKKVAVGGKGKQRIKKKKSKAYVAKNGKKKSKVA